MTFELSPVTWQTFSTFGTFLAVIVAIAYPSWRDRRRLRLLLRIGRLVDIPFPSNVNVSPPGPADRLVYTSSDPSDLNIRLSLKEGKLREGESPYHPVVVVLTITNTGRFPVLVDGWEIRFKGNTKVESKTVREQGVRPTEVGARGKILQLVSDEILPQMPTLMGMWVTDTIGRRWRVSGAQIRKIRAFKETLAAT